MKIRCLLFSLFLLSGCATVKQPSGYQQSLKTTSIYKPFSSKKGYNSFEVKIDDLLYSGKKVWLIVDVKMQPLFHVDDELKQNNPDGHKWAIKTNDWRIFAQKEQIASLEQHLLNLFGNNTNFKIVNRNTLEPLAKEFNISQSGAIENPEPFRLAGATHVLYNADLIYKLIDVSDGSIIAVYNMPYEPIMLPANKE